MHDVHFQAQKQSRVTAGFVVDCLNNLDFREDSRLNLDEFVIQSEQDLIDLHNGDLTWTQVTLPFTCKFKPLPFFPRQHVPGEAPAVCRLEKKQPPSLGQPWTSPVTSAAPTNMTGSHFTSSPELPLTSKATYPRFKHAGLLHRRMSHN